MAKVYLRHEKVSFTASFLRGVTQNNFKVIFDRF
jgi:hypothetical protein